MVEDTLAATIGRIVNSAVARASFHNGTPIFLVEAWNKGKLVGQKPPLRPKDVWAIRIRVENARAVRDRALFNLAIDSKLRGCDLVSLRVGDVTHVNRSCRGRKSFSERHSVPCNSS